MFPTLRRLVLSSLVVALVAPHVAVFAAPLADGQAAAGTISGTARSASGTALPGSRLQLRNIQSGSVVGTPTTAGAAGEFTFTGVSAGNYAVEILDSNGRVVGTGGQVSLTPTAMVVSNVAVTSSAAAAGSTGAASGAAAGGGHFLASTWGIVTIAAVAAGVAGVTVAATRNDASPSR